MKKLLGILVVLALVFSLAAIGLPSSVLADPAELYVGPGQTYSSIQNAVDNASEYDTIIVHDTSANPDYKENVDVNIDHLTIAVAGIEDVIVEAANSNDHVFEIIADYVDISGFTVIGATGSNKAGVYLASDTDNCVISHINANNNKNGIYLDSSSNNTLTGNTTNSNADDGIRIGNSSNNNFITNNTMNSNTDDGIILYFSSENTVEHNNMSDNKHGILLWWCGANNTIAINNVVLNTQDGIIIYRSANTIIEKNIISGSWRGIWLDTSDYNLVVNNLVHSNSIHGILGGSNYCKIFNNTIAGNGTGVVSAPSTTEIVNNILWGNGDDLFDCTASYSDISDGDLGTGNISVNPMFADASGGDYHLQSGSLCIDAGTNTGAPTEDIEGNARLQDGDGIGGAVTDMGAYEYVPASPPAIEADVDFAPNTLNLRSKGKWITCYIELLEGYDVEEINERTVTLLHGEASVTAEWGDIQDGVLMVKFDRSAVQEILTAGDGLELTVSGELMDETPFEGTDTIRVIE